MPVVVACRRRRRSRRRVPPFSVGSCHSQQPVCLSIVDGRDPHAPTNDLEEGGEGELHNHYRRRGKRERERQQNQRPSKKNPPPALDPRPPADHTRAEPGQGPKLFLCLTACCPPPPFPSLLKVETDPFLSPTFISFR